MKVGILTFHYAHNYGAMLQAYALSTVLQKQGFESELIDYRNRYIYDVYEKFSFYGLLNFYIRNGENVFIAFLKSIKNYHKKRNKDAKWYKFENFLSNYINKSDRVYNAESINMLGYDAVLMGSDQIWNESLTGGWDPLYFGKGLKDSIKKMSYAASTGHSEMPEEKWKIFVEYIKCIDKISVRENGFSIFLWNHKIANSIVADPIFLLNKTDWNRIAKYPKQSDYVLTYSFSESPVFFENAYRISQKLNKQLICILYKQINLPKDVVQIYDCSPQELLGFFQNSSLVITNSFHGTAFSILYNKQFLCVAPKKRRERVDSLIEKFGLQQQMVEDNQSITIVPSIDYDEVNNIINKYRIDSLNFLMSNLKD